jgi:hypothetical protein
MASTTNVFNSSSRAGGAWRERWLLLRDLLGGALLLVAWIALWTVTWAAVAGPLSPSSRLEGSPIARVEQVERS